MRERGLVGRRAGSSAIGRPPTAERSLRSMGTRPDDRRRERAARSFRGGQASQTPRGSRRHPPPRPRKRLRRAPVAWVDDRALAANRHALNVGAKSRKARVFSLAREAWCRWRERLSGVDGQQARCIANGSRESLFRQPLRDRRQRSNTNVSTGALHEKYRRSGGSKGLTPCS
jgi:hypothetical protein